MYHEVIEVMVCIIILTTEENGFIRYVIIAIYITLKASHIFEIVGKLDSFEKADRLDYFVKFAGRLGNFEVIYILYYYFD